VANDAEANVTVENLPAPATVAVRIVTEGGWYGLEAYSFQTDRNGDTWYCEHLNSPTSFGDHPRLSCSTGGDGVAGSASISAATIAYPSAGAASEIHVSASGNASCIVESANDDLRSLTYGHYIMDLWVTIANEPVEYQMEMSNDLRCEPAIAARNLVWLQLLRVARQGNDVIFDYYHVDGRYPEESQFGEFTGILAPGDYLLKTWFESEVPYLNEGAITATAAASLDLDLWFFRQRVP